MMIFEMTKATTAMETYSAMLAMWENFLATTSTRLCSKNWHQYNLHSPHSNGEIKVPDLQYTDVKVRELSVIFN